MSSSDGFCSNLSFSPGELGQVYTGHVPSAHHPSPAPISGPVPAQLTPVPTPITTSAPPSFDKPATPTFAAASPAAVPLPSPTRVRPPSPTRSNSVSSVATEISQSIGNNPTPTLGSVPSVAASFNGLPWTTPPQTPMAGVISRPGSVTGSVLGKRDTSESEKEDSAPRKKRVAPTLMSRPDEGRPSQ